MSDFNEQKKRKFSNGRQWREFVAAFQSSEMYATAVRRRRSLSSVGVPRSGSWLGAGRSGEQSFGMGIDVAVIVA
jgi:hypothetical protein